MRTKFLDYDVVKAARSLEENIPKGTLGAVLMVFESENYRYEVEFIDCDGDSLDFLTVDERDLQLVQRGECGIRDIASLKFTKRLFKWMLRIF